MLDDTSSSSEDLLQEMLKSSPVKTVEIPNLALSNRLTNKSPEISLQDFDM